jgi:hypothetical protein
MLQNIDANFDDLFDVVAILDADFTFLAKTAAQQLLNASPNGALNVPVGLYEFECEFSITNMSTSSGTFGFALGGSATLDSQAWSSYALASSPLSGEASDAVSFNTAANTALTANSTTGIGWAHIRGVFRVSAGGTIIPQVSFTVGGAISTVKKNSFFRCKKLNQNYKAAIIQPPLPRPSGNTPFWS